MSTITEVFIEPQQFMATINGKLQLCVMFHVHIDDQCYSRRMAYCTLHTMARFVPPDGFWQWVANEARCAQLHHDGKVAA